VELLQRTWAGLQPCQACSTRLNFDRAPCKDCAAAVSLLLTSAGPVSCFGGQQPGVLRFCQGAAGSVYPLSLPLGFAPTAALGAATRSADVSLALLRIASRRPGRSHLCVHMTFACTHNGQPYASCPVWGPTGTGTDGDWYQRAPPYARGGVGSRAARWTCLIKSVSRKASVPCCGLALAVEFMLHHMRPLPRELCGIRRLWALRFASTVHHQALRQGGAQMTGCCGRSAPSGWEVRLSSLW